MEHIGKYIVGLGVLLIMVGLVLWLMGDKMNWIGRLPGDIRIEKENFKLYIPLTTMLLISMILTLLAWAFRKFFS